MKREFVVLAAAIAATSANAGSLDFTAFPDGTQGTTSIMLPEAVVSTPDGADLFVGDLVPNSICALTAGFSCAADLDIDFTSAVTGLVFDINGFNTGDTVSLGIYDAADVFLDTFLIAGNGTADLTLYGAIGRLFFDDSSTGAGFSFANFTFDSADVPEPAALSLFGMGLVMLGARRRKL